MEKLFKNKMIAKIIEFTLTSLLLYSIFNIFKFNVGYFIKTGTQLEYYSILASAFIPIILLLFLGTYLILRKITLTRYPQITLIYKVDPEEKEMSAVILILLMITVCFMLKGFVASEIQFNQLFIKSIVTDLKFYIMDAIVLSIFLLIRSYKFLKVIKTLLFTKILFVWFIYLINLSGINMTNEYLNNQPISCNSKLYKTVNILIVVENKCSNGLSNTLELNEETTIFDIIKTINNETLSKKTRAEILKKFYDINDVYTKNTWIENNNPEIINKSYIFKAMKTIMKHKNADMEIIKFIIADDQIKMQDYLIKYQSPSLAIQIIKN